MRFCQAFLLVAQKSGNFSKMVPMFESSSCGKHDCGFFLQKSFLMDHFPWHDQQEMYEKDLVQKQQVYYACSVCLFCDREGKNDELPKKDFCRGENIEANFRC